MQQELFLNMSDNFCYGISGPCVGEGTATRRLSTRVHARPHYDVYIRKSDFQINGYFVLVVRCGLLVETWCQECSYGPNKNAHHKRISRRRTAERQQRR